MASARRSCRTAAAAWSTRPRLSSAVAAVARRLFHFGCSTRFSCSSFPAPLGSLHSGDCSISGPLWNSSMPRGWKRTKVAAPEVAALQPRHGRGLCPPPRCVPGSSRRAVLMNVFQCGSALNTTGSRCWWQASVASSGSFGSTIIGDLVKHLQRIVKVAADREPISVLSRQHLASDPFPKSTRSRAACTTALSVQSLTSSESVMISHAQCSAWASRARA